MITIKEFKSVFQNRPLGIQDARGKYAVLIPLVERQGEIYLLFELRAATLVGHQPSEVCFPGGRIEAGEEPIQAALRETWEEIGIPAEKIEIIAPLDLVQDISDRVVFPFLARVEPSALEHLKLSEAEVQEVFYVPLSFLMEEDPYIYTCPVDSKIGPDFPYEKIGFPEGYSWRGGKLDIPVYEYEGYSIFGMTGRMVRWLVKILKER